MGCQIDKFSAKQKKVQFHFSMILKAKDGYLIQPTISNKYLQVMRQAHTSYKKTIVLNIL